MGHTRKTAGRQYELDAFRIIGILGVMLYHYTFRGFTADNYSTLSFPDLGEVFKYGYLGVYFFLMISGYAMSISTSGKSVAEFATTRLARLFPIYWIIVTLITIVTLLIGADRFHVTFIQYLANLTMFNQNMGISSIDGAHWYMAVILKFNILVGIVLLFRLTRYQEYLAGIWLLVAGAIYYFDLPVAGFFFIPVYAPFLIAGILFRTAQTEGWNVYRYVLILLSLCFSVYIQIKDIGFMEQYFNHTFSPFIISSLVVLMYLAFCILSIRKKSINLPEAFILISSATFPLYLIHQYVGYMIFNSLGEWCNKYLLLSATIIIMILFSLFITIYIEPYVYSKSKQALEAVIGFAENKFRRTPA